MLIEYLKQTYKNKFIEIPYVSNLKIRNIFSNYTKKISYICYAKCNVTIIIPNSVKYLECLISQKKINLKITNNLKYNLNYKYTNEHKNNNITNIIFKHCLSLGELNNNFVNIFLLENTNKLRFALNCNVYNNKNIFILKHVKKINFHILYCIENLKALRNIYYLTIYDPRDCKFIDASVLCNVHIICFGYCHHLININKLTTNHTLKISHFYDENDYSKHIFTCITKLAITNYYILQNMLMTYTIRILKMTMHNVKQNETLNKYVDHLIIVDF